MKATLTFDLPDERSDLDLALNGSKYLCVLWDMDQEARNKLKYDEKITGDHAKWYEHLRLDIRERMENYGCSLEDGE
jgi:hypothetical protein